MINYWIIFAVLALIFKTAIGVYQKYFINDGYSALKVGFVWTTIGAIAFGSGAVYDIINSSYNLSIINICILASLGILEVLKSIIGLKALESADLSLLEPIRKSYVVPLAFIEPILFSVDFTLTLVLSTTIVVIGLFVTISSSDRSSIESLSILTNRGPLFAIVSGLIGIVLSLGSRFGATNFSPVTFGGFIYVSLAIGYTIWILVEEDNGLPIHLFKKSEFIGLGILAICQSFFTWSTFALISATVASTIFQLTVVTTTIAGIKTLDEKNAKRRIIGSLIILTGVIIAVLTTELGL